MTDIREHLAHKPLLFDGGMGTYYKAAPGADCEMANLTDPEGVKKVHAEYLAAGAQAIKTNTFGLPRMAAAQMPGWEELAEAGWKLACDAAAEKDAARSFMSSCSPFWAALWARLSTAVLRPEKDMSSGASATWARGSS